MKNNIILSCFSWFILAATAVQGANAMDWSPIQLSLLPSIQLIPEEKDIYGLKLNLPVGSNHNTYGIDLGFGSSGVNVYGIQANILANVFVFSDAHDYSEVNGMQLAGLCNVSVGTDVKGIQVAGLFNVSNVNGVQLSALVNTGDVHGLQCGFYNGAGKARGLQLGIVNSADDLNGIQIGLVNYIKNSPVPFLPIVNMKF